MRKYCSLVAWKAAHEFAIATFRTTDRLYTPKARPVFDQLRRAALSIETNIVEGYALDTTAQFRRHLRIARASAAESECLLRVLRELNYVDDKAIDHLHESLDLALKTIRGLLRGNLRATK